MARVLILREEADARRTAADVRARGHEALILPLQCVRPLDPPAGSEPLSGLIVTSAHAAAWAAGRASGSSFPILAVGARTAAALRAHGARNVVTGPGRASDLVALAADMIEGEQPFLYAAGRVRLPDLEEGLAAAGLPFRVAEIYDMVDRAITAEDVAAVLRDGAPDSVLLLSRRQAELFADLRARHGHAFPETLRCLCLSAGIAACLPAGEHAEWPDEPVLARLLDRLG
ncbi:uroporphyrinogen-III synthase [Aureimonas sp. ME7]|uniref:uroporphyrinogen-III synthase n=1 Tax=Aureimonas sp. ME7 TaxID=2744252 RepID=UPI0015F75AE8|nr:uroporphyrinogen-III synthase [Aureimonas sp. ME7]